MTRTEQPTEAELNTVGADGMAWKEEQIGILYLAQIELRTSYSQISPDCRGFPVYV